MAQKIYKLPSSVINQIAAGEVVENPASIVKELIENSIDAGARRISVEIQGGGLQSICIEDDGCGMSREDALLSLERHATSKIRVFDDLSQLATMGFRGEALAAVAAVSQFEMKTRAENEPSGIRLLSEGGQIGNVEPCARNRGTTLFVRSLFYNVPARKKFQKPAGANAAFVKRTVETIALAYPEIGFSLSSNGKLVLDVNPSKNKTRIEVILGSYEHEISFQKEEIRIWGFAASALKTSSNRGGQYLFINRRPVFSPIVSKAVKEAFGTRIDTASHPQFVLFLEMPPEQVDVNVHPQKKEVRFQNESFISHSFQEAVSSAFSSFPFEMSAALPSFSFQESSLPWESFPKSLPEFEPSLIEEKKQETLDLLYEDKPLFLFGPFLLLQKEVLLLVDLRAAHARILYEMLSQKQKTSQSLIWPIEIELEKGEEVCLEELHGMGIECRLLGEKTLAVDALPPFLDAAYFPLFFKNWKRGKDIKGSATHVCRNASKKYSMEEAQLLWQRLQQCSDRKYDPSGNPIWAEMKETDFDNLLRKK